MFRAGIFLFFSLFAATAMARSELADAPYPTGGDAHGIGGGDPLDGLLATAATEVRAVLGNWSSSPLESCPLSLPQGLCHRVMQLDPTQLGVVNTFALRAAKTLPRMPLQLVPVSGELNFCGEQGCRSVSARTALSTKGEIQVSRKFLEQRDLNLLVALVGHELGHKVPWKGGRPLGDESKAQGFESGREFLDSFGAVIAWKAAALRLPSQDAVHLPKDIPRAKYCAGVRSFGPESVGLAVDLTGVVAPGKIELLRSSPYRRGEIQRWVRRILRRDATRDEKQMLELLLSREANFATLVTALFSDPEYANGRRLMSDQALVESVLVDLLERTPSAEELGEAQSLMGHMGKSRYLLHVVTQGNGVVESRVRGWFRRWLNRTPSPVEEDKLVQMLRGGVSWEGAQRVIVQSREYRKLQKKRSLVCGSVARQGREAQ